jgi:putative ABC transport system permease protein
LRRNGCDARGTIRGTDWGTGGISGLYAATPELFTTLRVPAELGRTFVEEEGRPDGQPVALLSHGLWRSAFGGDPGIVGRSVVVNGEVRQVVGVMPPTFDVEDAGVQIWLPYVLDPGNRENRGQHVLALIGRLAPDATLEHARAELLAIAGRLAEENVGVHSLHPEEHPLYAEALEDDVLGNARTAILLLLGAVGFCTKCWSPTRRAGKASIPANHFGRNPAGPLDRLGDADQIILNS